MKLLLDLLDFVEFLVSPIGFAVALWLCLYSFSVQVLGLDVFWSILLPAFPAIDFYFLLQRVNF